MDNAVLFPMVDQNGYNNFKNISMKLLKLRSWKNVSIPVRDGELVKDFDTSYFIKQILNNVGEGISPVDMAIRVKILNKLDQIKPAAKEISFEDAEFNIIQECEAKIKWSFINKCFLDFHDDIVNAAK